MFRLLVALSCAATLFLAGPAVAASAGMADAATDTGWQSPPPPEMTPEIEALLKTLDTRGTWGHPDLFGEYAGLHRLFEGDYDGAMKFFRIGAMYADKFSQFSIAMLYLNGRGMAPDSAMACAWLMLAAEREYPRFVRVRNAVCNRLSPVDFERSSDELAKLEPVFGDAVAKDRMRLELRTARLQMTGSRVGFNFGVRTTCGGSGGGLMPGCGDPDFWDDWRWDPEKYFANRDAMWRGTVRVGDLKVRKALGSDNKASDEAE